MPRKPYIGITGITDLRETVEPLMLSTILQGGNVERLIKFGVLANKETIQGVQNKWANLYPWQNDIAGIFPAHSHALNIIQYNTDDENDDEESLLDQLFKLVNYGEKYCHGVQLHVAWPSVEVLTEFHKGFDDKVIVLQIGKRAFEMVEHSPKKLAEKVAEYEGLIQYVLLDQSGGSQDKTLELFELHYMYECLSKLKEQNRDMGLGVAVAPSPTTLDLILSLVKEFPYLSIDAQARLRTEDGDLNLAAVAEYTRKVLAFFGNNAVENN